MERSTWVEVNVAALEENLRAVARHAGVPVCAVVKANGYGHGIAGAARAFVRAGAAMLGVTRIEEARALRDAGIGARILILMPGADPHEAVKLDCEITVGSSDEVLDLPGEARVHLEIDTGMGRFGVSPHEAFPTAQAITRRANLVAVWTHFADAARTGRAQLARFRSVVDTLRRDGLEVRAHASNSAGLLAMPDARFDMVRVGNLLYGQSPPGVSAPWPLRPTFTWYARVAAVRTLEPGATVGYGSEWRAKATTRVATLPIGFFDGFAVEPAARTESVRGAARGLARVALRGGSSRSVSFGDRSAPVVGRAAMQALTVSLEGLPDVDVGSVARIPARRLMVAGDIERVYVEEPS